MAGTNQSFGISSGNPSNIPNMTIIPVSVTSELESKILMKRLLFASMTNICYVRMMFPGFFKNKDLPTGTAMIFRKKGLTYQRVENMWILIREAQDALEKKRLRELKCFITCDANQLGTPLESYKFKVDYEKDGETVFTIIRESTDGVQELMQTKITIDHAQGEISDANQFKMHESIEQTVKSELVKLCVKMNALPSMNAQFTIELFYNNDPKALVDHNYAVQPGYDRILLPDGSRESEDSLKHRLENNMFQPVHKCECRAGKFNEKIDGPYYTHLAAASSIEAMRELLENRFGQSGPAIRILQVRHTNEEGKTPDGCPIAKWIIRRSGPDEKVLCIVRKRPSHSCATAVIAVSIVIWDGIREVQANDLYNYFIHVLPKYGKKTDRRCETNDSRSCACQGLDPTIGGASFTLGCSWSMYSNTCKYCRSGPNARKFKLETADPAVESVLEEKCNGLADVVSPVLKRMAPACYHNQTYYSDQAQSCRLGNLPGGPFSGITTCLDFCAHSHKDSNNMKNGCTALVTLTKHRGSEKPNDEQFHVLPLCVLDEIDENGRDIESDKIDSGALERLKAYPMELRVRNQPLLSGREKKLQAQQQASSRKRAEKSPPEPSCPKKAKKSHPDPSDQHSPAASNGVLGASNCIYIGHTDNRQAFDDPNVGGVALALTHGSILLEVAKQELHASTALKIPDRRDPKRISIVFYQHQRLNNADHGSEVWEKKLAASETKKNEVEAGVEK